MYIKLIIEDIAAAPWPMNQVDFPVLDEVKSWVLQWSEEYHRVIHCMANVPAVKTCLHITLKDSVDYTVFALTWTAFCDKHRDLDPEGIWGWWENVDTQFSIVDELWFPGTKRFAYL
jgi:hypothetical protein